jgi:hypothetical protein
MAAAAAADMHVNSISRVDARVARRRRRSPRSTAMVAPSASDHQMQIIAGMGTEKRTQTRHLIIDKIDPTRITGSDDTVSPYLDVSFKSWLNHGARVYQHPAKLKISFAALQQMVAAFAQELSACYNSLQEEKLFDKLSEAKNKKPASRRRNVMKLGRD